MKPLILYKHFDQKFVDEILAFRSGSSWFKGHTQSNPILPTIYDPTIRQVDIIEIGDQSVKDLLFKTAQEYNDGMDITHIGEVHLLRYNTGGKFIWHSDVLEKKEHQRKLTMVIQLSEPENYEGGKLQIAGVGMEPFRNLGDLVIFPSNMRHRVTPVTKGVRYALITWIYGPPRPLDEDWH